MTYKIGKKPVTACEVNSLVHLLDEIKSRAGRQGFFDDEAWEHVFPLLVVIMNDYCRRTGVSDEHGKDCACVHFGAITEDDTEAAELIPSGVRSDGTIEFGVISMPDQAAAMKDIFNDGD